MKEMTEEQLEAAARLLCERRGIDPDAFAGIESLGFEPARSICQWECVITEIKGHCEVMLCIAEVMDKGD